MGSQWSGNDSIFFDLCTAAVPGVTISFANSTAIQELSNISRAVCRLLSLSPWYIIRKGCRR